MARRDEEVKKPECGSGVKGSYNTSAHVFALILILTLSTVGMLHCTVFLGAQLTLCTACGFPLISRRTSKNSKAGRFIFISQHFGTGVLIATAFVHLLPTAFLSLTNPCLPYFFNEGYDPLAGLVAMFSALIVVGLEMFLTTRGARHSHSHGGDWDTVPAEEELKEHGGRTKDHMNAQKKQKSAANGTLGKFGINLKPGNLTTEDIDASEGLVATSTLHNDERSSLDKSFEDTDAESDLDFSELDPVSLHTEHDSPPSTSHHHAPTQNLTPEEEKKRQILQCLLLEAGILFHSIFIGMAVSVATGPPFVVFLIAIAFHQSFEGLALGSRIAAIDFPKHSPRPWLMVLAYGTTTPIGQAIGLIVHRLYDPHSAAGLLMVGFMNAISSGLLLFAGLVQLLAEDFLSDKSYGILKGRRRWEAFSAVIGGACLMALVGAWA